MIFQFGTIQKETELDDGIVKVDQETIVNGSTTKQRTTYNQSIRVKDDKEALAEFLNLCDEYKAGKIVGYGMHCFSNANGQIIRVEKSWIV